MKSIINLVGLELCYLEIQFNVETFMNTYYSIFGHLSRCGLKCFLSFPVKTKFSVIFSLLPLTNYV